MGLPIITLPIITLPNDFSFIEVTSDDLERVQTLLRSNHLSFEDCGNHLSNFIGIEQEDQVIAIGGFEHVGRFALLRSVAVDSQFRGLGLGSSLIKQILGQFRLLKVEAVYILTETADQYFSQFCFEALEREKLPLEIQTTQQCQALCPASAIAMRLVL
jgi:N-acetylglutamate synthase-like GNAT family acetyltransferase